MKRSQATESWGGNGIRLRQQARAAANEVAGRKSAELLGRQFVDINNILTTAGQPRRLRGVERKNSQQATTLEARATDSSALYLPHRRDSTGSIDSHAELDIVFRFIQGITPDGQLVSSTTAKLPGIHTCIPLPCDHNEIMLYRYWNGRGLHAQRRRSFPLVFFKQVHVLVIPACYKFPLYSSHYTMILYLTSEISSYILQASTCAVHPRLLEAL